MTHDFMGYQRFGYKRLRSRCRCGWLSNYHVGDLAEVQAKTEWVRHQTEWLESLA